MNATERRVVNSSRAMRKVERESSWIHVRNLCGNFKPGWKAESGGIIGAVYWAVCERFDPHGAPNARRNLRERWVCEVTGGGDRPYTAKHDALWTWARSKVARYCRERGIRAPRVVAKCAA